jgi:CheY-like chemotaxis protein
MTRSTWKASRLSLRLWDEWGGEAVKVVAISASVLEHQRREYLEFGFEAFLDKPFRVERIYACLAELLEVEYEYAESVLSAADKPLDLSSLSVPEDVLQRLRAAAKVSNVTELERELDGVEAMGPAGQNLAAHLRRLSQDFEMDEILTILDAVEKV